MVTEAKLESVDGYTIVDIEGAARLVGPVRSAKKVLQRTTTDLVRHATYSCAIHGLDASGAATALNHDRTSDDQTPIATFAAEVRAWAKANNFTGAISLGLAAEEIGETLSPTAANAAELAAASAVSCLSPDAQTIVIASNGDEPALQAALATRSATVEPDLAAALASGADALFVRGKTGMLDHAVLEDTSVKAIIGLQPLTTTARGLAVSSRAGAIVVPDFLCAAGPTLGALGHSLDEITTMTSAAMSKLEGAGVDMFVAASKLAEDHLRTMTDNMPFGRPLAP